VFYKGGGDNFGPHKKNQLISKLEVFEIVYIYLKNSLIIQEQNTKKNHKRVVVLYVIKNHVNLHKL
jgi:hypothetical protein